MSGPRARSWTFSVARLDRFLGVMKAQAADGLRLSTGSPIALRKNGLVRPITKEALSEQQVSGLLREIVPAGLSDRLATGSEFAFTYDSPEGAVEVQVTG